MALVVVNRVNIDCVEADFLEADDIALERIEPVV